MTKTILISTTDTGADSKGNRTRNWHHVRYGQKDPMAKMQELAKAMLARN